MPPLPVDLSNAGLGALARGMLGFLGAALGFPGAALGLEGRRDEPSLGVRES
ncbi:MAG: hypothetical protein HY908_15045 [Myxococcales bacterium]|nr:hypothetical protein [Myxococcales bacterium]